MRSDNGPMQRGFPGNARTRLPLSHLLYPSSVRLCIFIMLIMERGKPGSRKKCHMFRNGGMPPFHTNKSVFLSLNLSPSVSSLVPVFLGGTSIVTC